MDSTQSPKGSATRNIKGCSQICIFQYLYFGSPTLENPIIYGFLQICRGSAAKEAAGSKGASHRRQQNGDVTNAGWATECYTHGCIVIQSVATDINVKNRMNWIGIYAILNDENRKWALAKQLNNNNLAKA